MEATLQTLSGDYDFPRRRLKPVRRKVSPEMNWHLIMHHPGINWQEHGEFMGGWLSDTAFGNFVKGSWTSLKAPFTGVGHFAAETVRGVKTGDIKRVVVAPIKGVGHYGLQTYRGTADTAKIGVPILSTVGAVPTPASPFLLGGAALLAGLGALRERQKLRSKLAAGESLTAEEQKTLSDFNKRNVAWVGGGIVAAGIIGLFALG